MNFLAHYVLATRFLAPVDPLPLYVVGTALPDLVPLAAPSRRLRLAGLDDTPQTSTDAAALSAGVRVHLRTDAAFHKTPAFLAAQARVGDLVIRSQFAGIRVRRFFLAHVLTELALDAVLLRRQPDLADGFYHRFASAGAGEVVRWTEAALGQPLPALPGVLSRFLRSQYLTSYAADEGVAEGMNRVSVQARQHAFRDDNRRRLVGLVAETIAVLAETADALLAETAAVITGETLR